MPDISMCFDNDCPMRSKCYRYSAKPGKWQSYGDFARLGADKCRAFIRNRIDYSCNHNGDKVVTKNGGEFTHKAGNSVTKIRKSRQL